MPKETVPTPLGSEMEEVILRLLKCLKSEEESRALGPGLVRELLFRALKGEQAAELYALVAKTGNISSVARALEMIHADYDKKLYVEQLAELAHMSASSFHRVFKEVTSDSPMQYLKKLRLNKARDLMEKEGLKAFMAADRVGYESPSQFSREFKRYFGKSPSELTREVLGF